jgi:hypothetical protein
MNGIEKCVSSNALELLRLLKRLRKLGQAEVMLMEGRMRGNRGSSYRWTSKLRGIVHGT